MEEVLKAVWDVEAKVGDKLSAMKQEMESADDHLVKKICLNSNPTFNEQVKDKLDTVASTLQQTPPTVEKDTEVIVDDLALAEFVPNVSKSKLTP